MLINATFDKKHISPAENRGEFFYTLFRPISVKQNKKMAVMKNVPVHVDFYRTKKHIPPCETAKTWSHLADIVTEIPPLLNMGIGLSICYNCSRALTPRQLITEKNDKPNKDKSWGGGTQLVA